jgi:hypothetical protein
VEAKEMTTRCGNTPCRNRLGARALDGWCYRCWTTPPEIRSREIKGCLSLDFLDGNAAERRRLEREKKRQEQEEISKKAKQTASWKRKAFRVVRPERKTR